MGTLLLAIKLIVYIKLEQKYILLMTDN